MTERSLTPSPLRSQNLERGVFSSLSTLSLYKQAVEERKQLQSSSALSASKSPLAKPRSPLRVQPVVKKVEKSPEATARSPLKIKNKTKEEIDVKNELELLKLQENIKSLNLQLAREKRMHLKLEAEIKEMKTTQALELASLASNNEKIQKSLQGLMASSTQMTSDKEKLTEEIKKVREKYEESKEHLRSTGGILVSIISMFFSNFEEDLSLVGQEKLRIGSKIKEIVSEKLNEIMASTNIDLNRQVTEVHSWLLARNLPRKLEKKKKEKEKEKEKGKGKITKETPELSYTVEYFEESQNSLGPTAEYWNMGREGYKEEVSFTDSKAAIALYDFEGERDEDLAFFSGDTIEVIEECESGWWVGRLHGKTGSFPYNFVQII